MRLGRRHDDMDFVCAGEVTAPSPCVQVVRDVAALGAPVAQPGVSLGLDEVPGFAGLKAKLAVVRRESHAARPRKSRAAPSLTHRRGYGLQLPVIAELVPPVPAIPEKYSPAASTPSEPAHTPPFEYANFLADAAPAVPAKEWVRELVLPDWSRHRRAERTLERAFAERSGKQGV